MINQVGNEVNAAVQSRSSWAMASSNMTNKELRKTASNNGNKAAEEIEMMLTKAIFGDRPPAKAKKGVDYHLVNINRGEIAKANKYTYEILLDGCLEYLKLDKKSQKAILEYDHKKMIEYLNENYNK